jgi:HEPN domain-containing protein
MRSEPDDPKAWLRYAEEDLRAAALALTDTPPLLLTAVYHAQQAAEKMLKAALIAHGAPFPRTHDLALLWKLCAQRDAACQDISSECERLNRFGSEMRYPAVGVDEPTLADAREAHHLAGCSTAFARARLS